MSACQESLLKPISEGLPNFVNYQRSLRYSWILCIPHRNNCQYCNVKRKNWRALPGQPQQGWSHRYIWHILTHLVFTPSSFSFMAPRKAEISENNKLHSFEILEELDISVVKISFQTWREQNGICRGLPCLGIKLSLYIKPWAPLN